MTNSEENYLKVIYHLSLVSPKGVNTNAIAGMLETKASSVTDMMKKLAEKELVLYQKYQGVTLTEKGFLSAKMIVRKHRLWEVFLVEKLDFAWDEVHEIAEELEHIKNDKLIKKLSEKLGHPNFDPHGDPIPDEKGKIQKSNFIKLSEAKIKSNYKIMGVTDHSTAFLKYLEKHQLIIGASINIKTIEEFDNSIILVCQKKEVSISPKAAECIIVETL